MDGIALPLAMIILAYTLRSLRLMIIPLITITCGGLLAFGLMYFVTLMMPVISITPSLM
jgi:predicted RND superfamily exporter protein